MKILKITVLFLAINFVLYLPWYGVEVDKVCLTFSIWLVSIFATISYIIANEEK